MKTLMKLISLFQPSLTTGDVFSRILNGSFLRCDKYGTPLISTSFDMVNNVICELQATEFAGQGRVKGLTHSLDAVIKSGLHIVIIDYDFFKRNNVISQILKSKQDVQVSFLPSDQINDLKAAKYNGAVVFNCGKKSFDDDFAQRSDLNGRLSLYNPVDFQMISRHKIFERMMISSVLPELSPDWDLYEIPHVSSKELSKQLDVLAGRIYERFKNKAGEYKHPYLFVKSPVSAEGNGVFPSKVDKKSIKKQLVIMVKKFKDDPDNNRFFHVELGMPHKVKDHGSSYHVSDRFYTWGDGDVSAKRRFAPKKHVQIHLQDTKVKGLVTELSVEPDRNKALRSFNDQMKRFDRLKLLEVVLLDNSPQPHFRHFALSFIESNFDYFLSQDSLDRLRTIFHDLKKMKLSPAEQILLRKIDMLDFVLSEVNGFSLPNVSEDLGRKLSDTRLDEFSSDSDCQYIQLLKLQYCSEPHFVLLNHIAHPSQSFKHFYSMPHSGFFTMFKNLDKVSLDQLLSDGSQFILVKRMLRDVFKYAFLTLFQGKELIFDDNQKLVIAKLIKHFGFEKMISCETDKMNRFFYDFLNFKDKKLKFLSDKLQILDDKIKRNAFVSKGLIETFLLEEIKPLFRQL